ncbi:CBN-DHS-20 protein [Aphelenchoides avenae]|nr:CBN-DHS-20 protein [Aphelenchus avenae]
MLQLVIGLAVAYYVLRYLRELIALSGLSKRAVFITGADTGFGHLLALKCAENGLPTFAGCLTREGVDRLKEKARGLRGSLHTIQVDVRDEESVRSATKYVEENLTNGQYLWAIVNNAGILSICPDAWSDVEEYRRTANVNLYGVIRVTHAFLPTLKRSKGRIITCSSVSGRYSVAAVAPYCVSKYGVEAYMDSIRREYRPFGIRCSILAPGSFRTGLISHDFVKNSVEGAWSKLSHEVREEYGEQYKENMISELFETVACGGTDRVDYVVDNYYHAITARFPRNRYACGWDALFIHVPISFLPTELQDFVVDWLRGSKNLPTVLETEAKKAKAA